MGLRGKPRNSCDVFRPGLHQPVTSCPSVTASPNETNPRSRAATARRSRWARRLSGADFGSDILVITEIVQFKIFLTNQTIIYMEWWRRRESNPRAHGCAMPLDRRAAGGESNPICHASDRGRYGHQTRQAAVSRNLWNVRGAQWDTADVLHRSRDCHGVRGSRGGQGGIPAVPSRGTVTATPSAPNKRPAASVESDTPRSPQATAGQLHRGASRSNAGPTRLRRKTADRPAKLTDSRRRGPLTRRRVRSLLRAAHRPPMHLPASRPAAVRGPFLTGLLNTPSLTRSAGDPSRRRRRSFAPPGSDIFSSPGASIARRLPLRPALSRVGGIRRFETHFGPSCPPSRPCRSRASAAAGRAPSSDPAPGRCPSTPRIPASHRGPSPGCRRRTSVPADSMAEPMCLRGASRHRHATGSGVQPPAAGAATANVLPSRADDQPFSPILARWPTQDRRAWTPRSPARLT